MDMVRYIQQYYNNHVEIYLNFFPSTDMRTELKQAGFRWYKGNKCWWAESSEEKIAFAKSFVLKYNKEGPAMDQQELIKVLKSARSICWYPSAAYDLRPMLFLTSQYCAGHEKTKDIKVFPDLFVFTDYGGTLFKDDESYVISQGMRFLNDLFLCDNDVLVKDIEHRPNKERVRTVIQAKKVIKIITDISEPELDSNNISFPLTEHYGKGYCIDVDISSKTDGGENALGQYRTKMVYLFSENSVFAKEILLRNSIKVDYLVRIRCGYGSGGCRYTTGYWMDHLFKPLGVKYLIQGTGDQVHMASGDQMIIDSLRKEFELPDTPQKPEQFYHVVWGTRNKHDGSKDYQKTDWYSVP